MEPIISVRDLYKIFKIGDTEVYALNGLNFDRENLLPSWVPPVPESPPA